jgi:hypothetical protein
MDGSVSCLTLFLFFRKMNPIHDNRTKEREENPTIFSMLEVCLCSDAVVRQRGSFSGDETAHNSLFPWTNTLLAFWKTPPVGTGPSRLLNDKLRSDMELKASKKSGI